MRLIVRDVGSILPKVDDTSCTSEFFVCTICNKNGSVRTFCMVSTDKQILEMKSKGGKKRELTLQKEIWREMK